MKSQKLVINYVQQLYDCAISNWIYQGKKWLPSEKLGSQTLFHFTAVNQQSFFQVTKTSPQLINQDSYLTAIIWMSKSKRLVVGPVKSDDLIDLYAEDGDQTSETVDMTLVPYYAWANREDGQMRVWLNK